jgi:Caspase domain
LGRNNDVSKENTLSEDLVALVVGIASYPGLPDDWSIADERTVRDAIEVTKLLRRRGVPINKIKLLLSAKENTSDIEGVPVTLADHVTLENFITKQLGAPPFDGERFFLFLSGHGVEARETSELVVILADSFRTVDGPRVFYVLAVEHFRNQLKAKDRFKQQLFCINACRTPAEWAISADDRIEKVVTVPLTRRPVQQVRFFAAGESQPAPVEARADGLSNNLQRLSATASRTANGPREM